MVKWRGSCFVDSAVLSVMSFFLLLLKDTTKTEKNVGKCLGIKYRSFANNFILSCQNIAFFPLTRKLCLLQFTLVW